MVKENTDMKLKKLVFNFSALLDLSEEITSVKDFTGVIKSSLYLLMGTVPILKGAILENDYKKGILTVSASKGIEGLTGQTFKIERETTIKLKKEKDLIDFNPKLNLFKKDTLWKKLNPHIVVPVVIKSELIAIITLGRKLSDEDYTDDDKMLLSIISRHIGISIHNYHLMKRLYNKANENKKLFEELQSIYYDTIQALAAAIDAKDPYTRGHSYRVSNYCEAIAKELNFTKREIEGIKIAGFLHDIGKLAIDKKIINKPTSLTTDEFGEMYMHPKLSYEILSRVRFPWEGIASSVLYHHEKLDGTGYPEKLTDVEIPKMAKIMALADAFDAMTTDRPYKKKLTLEAAILEIKNNVGTQFAPDIAIGLLKFIRSDIKSDERRVGLLNWVNFNFSPDKKTKIVNHIKHEISHIKELHHID